MRRILRVLRHSVIVLLACSAPGVCPAAVQLGVEVLDMTDGAAILAVKPGSLADANGLLPDDKIVQIDGKKISSARDLQDELGGMARRKRSTQIIVMRYASFVTVRLKKRPFRAKPFVAASGVQWQDTEQCLRSPSIDCLGAHLLAAMKSGTDVNPGDAASISRRFLRIGRPDLASEFLNVGTESFLAHSRTLDGYHFVRLAEAHRAAGVPLLPGVLEKARKMAKQPIGLENAVRGLHIAGKTELAEQLLQEALANVQARYEWATQLPWYFFDDIASGYALLGNLQSADAVKLDSRFSPEERFELDLAIAGMLVRERLYEAVPKALDQQLAVYRTTSPSMDSKHFSKAALLYWQSGNVAATEQIAEYLLARMKAGGAADVSRRGDIDATVEVLGLLGRIPEALALIEASMAGAAPARRAEVDYLLVSSAIRRSGQNELDPRLRPVADRALANWRGAYVEATQWPQEYEKWIAHLYKLQTRNGSEPPTASEMEWQAGPSIDATARKSLGSAIASAVLTGLNEARRTDIGPAWAMSARASLNADRRRLLPLSYMAMLMAADGNLDQAIRFSEEVFGEDRQLEVARDEARLVKVPSLIAARDFDAIARIYATLTRPLQKMDVLLDLLIRSPADATRALFELAAARSLSVGGLGGGVRRARA